MYARVPAARARELHRRAGLGIERRVALPELSGERSAELAHHWERAGETAKAVHYLGLAGERALRSGAHNDAHRTLSRALSEDAAIGRPGGAFRRARWERMLAVASFGIGDLEGSIRHSAGALRGLGEPVPRSAVGWTGLALFELGRMLWPVRAAPSSPAQRERRFEVAQACGQLATTHFYNADGLPTVASLLRGLNRARRTGDEATIVESMARLAYVSGTLGLRGVARSLFRRAHERAVSVGDPRGNALALYLDGMYQEVLGEWERCRELAEKAHETLRAIGDHPEAETALAIASHGYFFAGHLERARECGATILQAAEARGHHHHVAWGLYLVGRCDAARGEFDAAIARLEPARHILAPLPDAIDIVICEGWLARALLGAGRLDEAVTVARALGRRIAGGKRPAVAQGVDGYAGWADVALDHWKRMPGAPGVGGEATGVAASQLALVTGWRAKRTS